MFKSVTLACIAFGFALPTFAQQVPHTLTKTLDGREVSFPKTTNGKPLLILVGFSHKSSGDLMDWNRLCVQRYWTDTRLEYYELADLQGLPFFVKPMVLHGMRKVLPVGEHAHFAPFYQSEADWKQVMHYTEPKNMYLALADAAGNIVWKAEGPATSVKCKDLLEEIDRVIK